MKGTLAAYDRIKKAQEETAKILPIYNYFETFRGKHGASLPRPARLLQHALQICAPLLRAGDERPKPNGERFPEFRDSNQRIARARSFFESQPIYEDLEQVMLTDSLTDLATRFGSSDPLVQKVLAGKSPAARAARVGEGTKLKDVAFRKQIV